MAPTRVSFIACRAAGRLASGNALKALPPRRITMRSRIPSGFSVYAAVKYDYDTKVFKKELVKFADTEEFIYR